jgi:preprotein translocase subunit SecF
MVLPHETEKKALPFYRAYRKFANKAMYFILLLFIISLSFLIYQQATTGQFIQKDITLAGGVSFSFSAPPDIQEDALRQIAESTLEETVLIRSIGVGQQREFTIESRVQDRDRIAQLTSQLEEMVPGDVSVSLIGQTLGASFFRDAIFALIVAFILMGAAVFIIFRQPLPSAYVVFAAAATIVETVFITNIFGITLSTGGLAALLMLLGYSVDTDIVLTTRVLKSRGQEVYERAIAGLRTGLTMSITSLAATLTGFIVSQSPMIKEIMLVLTIGIVFDILNTWLFNAPILVKYVEKKEGVHRK